MRCSPFRLIVSCFFTLSAGAQVNVLTYKYDNARTGQNLNEPLLSPANVSGQPLYMAAVPLANGNTHDLVVVATAHDSVYAFDADDNLGPNSAPLWQASFIDPSQGVTTVPWQDVNCYWRPTDNASSANSRAAT